ncbi:MAG: hypothetical protein SynsKO_00060 [Synoicihabitans sp.]
MDWLNSVPHPDNNNYRRTEFEDVIDELIITRVPALLKSGIPPFENSGAIKKFQHLKTDIHNESLVMSHYRRNRH